MTVIVKGKTPLVAPDHTPTQCNAIDPAVAEGLDDIKHGRLQGPFSSHKEFIASLHRESRKLGTKKQKRPVR